MTIIFGGCGSSGQLQQEVNLQKVKFDLSKYDENGLTTINETGEKKSIDFEFCIPALSRCIEEVKAIDPGIRIYPQEPGRLACRENFILCAGNSGKSNFKSIIANLSQLKYIEFIVETEKEK